MKEKMNFNSRRFFDPLWIPGYLSNSGHYIVFFNKNGEVERLTIADIKRIVNGRRKRKVMKDIDPDYEQALADRED